MPPDFSTLLRPCFTTTNVNIPTYLLFAKFPLFDLLSSAVLYLLASLSSLSSSEDTDSNIMPHINMYSHNKCFDLRWFWKRKADFNVKNEFLTQILFESVWPRSSPCLLFLELSQMKSYIVAIKIRYDLHSTVSSTKLNGLIWGGWPRTLQTTLSTPFFVWEMVAINERRNIYLW